jgi:hypothetical protein
MAGTGSGLSGRASSASLTGKMPYGRRVARLAGTAVLVLGSAAALAAPAQAGVAQAGVAQAVVARAGGGVSGSRLWHPTAFGHGAWVNAAAGPAAGAVAAPVNAQIRPAGTTGGWVPEPTPNPSGVPNGALLAEACGTPQACEAVGDYYNSAGAIVLLAERWTGENWTVQAAPAPAGASGSQLTGVSCLSAGACTAAGYYTNSAGVIVPLVETWNGTSWAIQAVPAPAGASASGFLAVSCTSASACTAVGDDTNPVGASLPLAERWNGTTWSVQATPNPAGADATGLFAVSCASATACTATGSTAGSSGTPSPLAEAWHGTTWKVQATALPAGAGGGQLTGVSCTSAQACTATGYASDNEGGFAALAERWNGTAWGIQATPNPAGAGQSALSAVSCTSPTACTAAGAYIDKTGMPTLAEAWNGTAWSIQNTPNPPDTRGNQFDAIACTSPARCTAVGQQADQAGTPSPLGEALGSAGWGIVVTPAPTGARSGQLTAVSCPATNSCTAVGNYYRRVNAPSALAETWNGTRWRIQPATDPAGSTGSYLQGVSCSSPQACTAVGFYFTRGARPALPLAESWNGTSWSVRRVPVPAGAAQTWLYAVSCVSPRTCTAVGYYHNSAGAQKGLAERWDGTAWSMQKLGAAAKNAALSGVSCPTASDCVAVGFVTGTADAQPIALAWNGTSWRSQRVPLTRQAQGGVFSQVSCPAANACMATGSVFAAPGGAFAEFWNGTTWRPEHAPNPPLGQFSMGEITLASVSCISATDCAAVGNFTPRGQPEVFAETWDGTTWQREKITLPAGTDESMLDGVSCTAAGCTAAGWHVGDAGIQVTMALGDPSAG